MVCFRLPWANDTVECWSVPDYHVSHDNEMYKVFVVCRVLAGAHYRRCIRCRLPYSHDYMCGAPFLFPAPSLSKVMDHLESNREVFEPYVEDDESFDDYLGRMRGEGEWGGNQELVAASQLYKVCQGGRNECCYTLLRKQSC